MGRISSTAIFAAFSISSFDRRFPFRLSSIFLTRMGTGHRRQWTERTGLLVYECYGMSESASITTFDHYYRHAVGSVGTPVPGLEFQIRDKVGHPVKTGENVYPRKVEELLYTRPEVQESAVIGLPHTEWGEQVTAYIIPKPGKTIDPQDLKAFLKS